MPVDISQFFDGFFDEVDEHLAVIEELAVTVETADATREHFDALFRAAHSIKGASRTFGFAEMAELTHVLESVLDRARESLLDVDKAFVNAVLATADVLRGQLAAYRAKETPEPAGAAIVTGVLEKLLAAPSTGRAAAPAPVCATRSAYHITFRTEREAAQAESAITAVVAALRDLGDCTFEAIEPESFACTFEGTQSRAALEDVFAYISHDGDALEIIELPPPVDLDAEFGFFDDGPVVAAVPEVNAAAAPERIETVRVKLSKIDALVNLVGEMLIAQSTLQECAARLDPAEYADLHASIAGLQRHTRDLRESVMSVRMLPIGTIFGRFPRMIRELSEQLGKEVRFETSGDDTELDKGLIEGVSDPLTHIIRNAIDHGIEMPDDREAAGKARQGSIVVRSFQRGGKVVVEVRDDGAGMDRERILAKARAHDIAVRDDMTEREVWALTCAPGFSTAAHVTDVSGRGVGMDVAKRNIIALGGTLEIDSAPGKGTTISLIVPLTLAIADGLAVRASDDVFIVPLASIVESIPIAQEDVVKPPQGVPFIMYRGDALPLVAAPGCTMRLDGDRRLAVVIEADGCKAGLLVDELESEHQVVIKSLERNFRRVDGFSGATILGNGRVALILDIPALVGG